jgi:site-specific recombinase XerD
MPHARMPSNKGRRLPPEPFSQDEVRGLFRACSDRAPAGIRNRALIVVFYRSGLRVSEALSLMPKDCDIVRGTHRVLHGKGDRSRLVGLDPEASAILQRWLDQRSVLGIGGRDFAFCTLNGTTLRSAYVRNLMKRLGRRAEILKRVHPHGLRHTHAYEPANEGTPLHVIQQQLGPFELGDDGPLRAIPESACSRGCDAEARMEGLTPRIRSIQL